ncbi:hypothetical protein [Streptomyces sp. NPDC057910]
MHEHVLGAVGASRGRQSNVDTQIYENTNQVQQIVMSRNLP